MDQQEEEVWICTTCGLGCDADSAPTVCPICADDRQWVPSDGQHYTTLKELRASHHNVMKPLEEEGVLWGIGTEPKFAIGQRAILVKTRGGSGNVLWDCISLVDDDTVQAIKELGGIQAIALSHPHFIATASIWQKAFTPEGGSPPPVYLHEWDREWVPSSQLPSFTFWAGDALTISVAASAASDGGNKAAAICEGGGQDQEEEQEQAASVRLIRVGGHFPGSAVALVQPQVDGGGRGILLVGDTIFPVPHQGWVSFMYSFPNLLPLPAPEVEAIRDRLAPHPYQRLYGPFWHTVIAKDADRCVAESAGRYLDALSGRYHHNEQRERRRREEEEEERRGKGGEL